jgi:hypothetical protein
MYYNTAEGTNSAILQELLHGLLLYTDKYIMDPAMMLDQHNMYCTEFLVRQASRLLEPMIISEIDKNGGVPSVWCAYAWHKAFDVMYVMDPHYHVLQTDTQSTLEAQRNVYQQFRMDKVAKWQPNGDLPYAYILPKMKDLTKSRPVVACVNHPSRTTLRVAAKAGSLVLKHMDTLGHFDI